MDIGFICRLNSVDATPHSAFLLHRIIPMIKALQKENKKLLIFSPKHLNTQTGMVNGYYLENDTFVKTMAPIPRIIANYYAGTGPSEKQYGIKYADFKAYVKKNGSIVFPTYAFIPFTKDKLTNFSFLQTIDKQLSPHTELFDNPTVQLPQWLGKSDKLFLKPRTGRMGNGIIVITKQKNKITLTHYDHKKHQAFELRNNNALIEQTEQFTQGKPYLIQTGLDCLTWKQRPFTCRVVMLKDHIKWHCFHMILLAGQSSDLSNTHQGGDTHPSHDFLSQLLREKQVDTVIHEIKRKAYQAIQPLNEQFPKTLYEVAFDFVVTTDLTPWIIEINSHPGMSRPNLPRIEQLKDYVKLSQDQKNRFDECLDPYGQIIVDFLVK